VLKATLAVKVAQHARPITNDMTRETAEKLLPLIKAYVGGEIIQYKYNSKWVDAASPAFDDESEYRIKPKPLELWVNVYEHGSSACFESKSTAEFSLRAGGRTVHMREVV